jgi:hypothetical protein
VVFQIHFNLVSKHTSQFRVSIISCTDQALCKSSQPHLSFLIVSTKAVHPRNHQAPHQQSTSSGHPNPATKWQPSQQPSRKLDVATPHPPHVVRRSPTAAVEPETLAPHQRSSVLNPSRRPPSRLIFTRPVEAEAATWPSLKLRRRERRRMLLRKFYFYPATRCYRSTPLATKIPKLGLKPLYFLMLDKKKKKNNPFRETTYYPPHNRVQCASRQNYKN